MTLPLVGVSKPASKPNSVDLPEPELPVMATEEPADILMLMAFSIVSSPSGAATDLHKLVASRMVCIDMINKVPTRSNYNSLTILTILMCILLLSSSAFAEKDKTIVIIGDSLSAAHNIPIETAWPQLLQQKLIEKKYPYKIINTSISGDTSYTALNRSKKMLPRLKPDVCLIAIGANDGLQGLTLKQLKNNLHKLVKLCQQYTNKVMLFEIKLPSNYGQTFIARFSNIYHQVAKQEGIKLLPFFMEPFALDFSMFLEDRIHPTEQAQPIMANIVWEGIVDLMPLN